MIAQNTHIDCSSLFLVFKEQGNYLLPFNERRDDDVCRAISIADLEPCELSCLISLVSLTYLDREVDIADIRLGTSRMKRATKTTQLRSTQVIEAR